MTKKIIRVADEDIRYRLEGTLKDGIALLTQLSAELGPTATIDIDYNEYDGITVQVYVEREETDEEYAFRLKREAICKEQQDARDRREFERLAAKFKKD